VGAANVRFGLLAQEANVFAKQGPDAGEVGDVDCDGSFACVPEHVGGGVDIAEIVNLGEDSGDNLEGD
jgi:hypothetical protein